MKFIWFFFIVYTMGYTVSLFEGIKNTFARIIIMAFYYAIMALIAYAIYLKFGITTYA